MRERSRPVMSSTRPEAIAEGVLVHVQLGRRRTEVAVVLEVHAERLEHGATVLAVVVEQGARISSTRLSRVSISAGSQCADASETAKLAIGPAPLCCVIAHPPTRR